MRTGRQGGPNVLELADFYLTMGQNRPICFIGHQPHPKPAVRHDTLRWRGPGRLPVADRFLSSPRPGEESPMLARLALALRARSAVRWSLVLLCGWSTNLSQVQAEDCVRVEEEWELVVGEPDINSNAPQ